MLYVKSMLAGLAAILLATILIFIGGICAVVIIASRQTHTGHMSVGWDPISFGRSGAGWIILGLAFLIGFWWEYRRASGH